MRWPARVGPKIQSFFVTTTTGEGGGTSSGGTSTTWTGSPEVRPDARQPDAVRSLSARHIAKRTEIRNSSSRFASSKGTVSHLQREWKQAHFLGNTLPSTFWSHRIKRQWLCFSPTMKKPSCQSCWLLGDPSAIQKTVPMEYPANRITSE